MNLVGEEEKKECLGSRAVGWVPGSPGDRWSRETGHCTVSETSRRELAIEEKVRDRNAAGLKEGAKSRIPELLRKLCLSPNNILER